jgi:hypothetical protein
MLMRRNAKEETSMKDPRPNILMMTAFVLGLAALLVGPAQARVVDTDGSTVATDAQQPFDGGLRAVQTPAVDPYLSQGIGVDKSQFGGLRGDDTVDRGWYTGLEYKDMSPVATDDTVNRGWYTGLEYKDMPSVPTETGDGFGWRDGGITTGLATALLALASAAFLASRRRTRLAMR